MMLKIIFTAIAAFISGGGITVLLKSRFIRRRSKVEFAQTVIDFWQKQLDDVIKRQSVLEGQIKELSKLKCERVECDRRIP